MDTASETVLLASFPLDVLRNSTCGCPHCGQGEQPRFEPVQHFPDHLTHLGLENDVKDIMAAIDAIMYETGYPPVPILLLGVCFFPICCIGIDMCCVKAKRLTGTAKAIDDWNKEKGHPKGISVCMNDDYNTLLKAGGARGSEALAYTLKPALDVNMHVAEYQQYCSREGIQFNPALLPQPAMPAQNGVMPTQQGYPMQNAQPTPITEQPPSAYNNVYPSVE